MDYIQSKRSYREYCKKNAKQMTALNIVSIAAMNQYSINLEEMDLYDMALLSYIDSIDEDYEVLIVEKLCGINVGMHKSINKIITRGGYGVDLILEYCGSIEEMTLLRILCSKSVLYARAISRRRILQRSVVLALLEFNDEEINENIAENYNVYLASDICLRLTREGDCPA
ncbi:hypothetical protein [Pannonibacter sp. SL95]|uniref:hypothetical protein n=1 Tax=Pannonibacter sp. SL95 TaxID=2995153 RepID=UPI0022744784|nr:hypothetical protein [Pannonibacter sp. SL95]MCY1708989.1 hypothetical protein [Pannonibacter sp. SL95]